MTRPCKICGETIPPRLRESPSDYRRRATCGGEACRARAAGNSSRARALARRRAMALRVCEACGQPIPIGDSTPHQYRKRRYCDQLCFRRARRPHEPVVDSERERRLLCGQLAALALLAAQHGFDNPGQVAVEALGQSGQGCGHADHEVEERTNRDGYHPS